MTSPTENSTVPPRVPGPAASRQPRRWLYRILASTLAVVVMEIVCQFIVWVQHGGMASIADLRRRAEGVEAHNLYKTPASFILHPYIGAILQPTGDPSAQVPSTTLVNDYGFPGNVSPVQSRSKDQVLIGILGGSVAKELCTNGGGEMVEQLSLIPEFSGRDIVLIPLAMDGYKQPQQLAIVAYLLSVGAEFDVLINLDGVNEAALPIMDNIPNGVNAAFPRNWNTMISSMSSIELQRHIGYVTYLRLKLKERALSFSASPWRFSATAALIWKSAHDRTENEILQELHEIQRLTESEMSYGASGPPESFDSDAAIFEHSVDLWFRSSRCLATLCDAHHISYLHCLQPNQYLAGSKPLTESEQQLAINNKSPFRRPVIQCYPTMRDAGKKLGSLGIHFFDLTQIFVDNNETVYRDDCCHFYETGNRVLAKAIAVRLAEVLESGRQPAGHQPEMTP